ncbi:MAG: hypothetical protein KDC45_01630 [Bacteroidetes bacterium]|nr:hypothetical protein [Bacteroidota bacterium]
MEITPETVEVSIPRWRRFLDFFQPEDNILVEWRSPDSEHVQLFKGLQEFEPARNATFVVRGKPAYCDYVVRELAAKGTITDKRNGNLWIGFWMRRSIATKQ